MSSYYCRLCLTNCSFEDSSLLSKHIIEMIEYCIPEFDIKLVNNPIICGLCHNLLKQSEEFKRKCLMVQEEIRNKKSLNNSSNKIIYSDMNNLTSIDILHSEKTSSEYNLSSFNESFKKFLTSGPEKSSNTLDDLEFSDILNDTNEDNRGKIGNDEFLNLLESSPNIKLDLETQKLLTSESDSLTNFYDDNNKSKLYISHEKKPGTESGNPDSTKGKSPLKNVKNMKVIDNPLDVLFEKFCCISCELRLNSMSNLIRHLYTVHHKVGELYTCIICRYKSRDYKGIRRHYQHVHNNCVDLKGSCIFCATDKLNYSQLHIHMRKEHSKYCLAVRFRCNSCDFQSRRYDIFRRHFFKSHDFICNYCLKSFESIECLNRHISHHAQASKLRKN